jgi:hypothetical protein
MQRLIFTLALLIACKSPKEVRLDPPPLPVTSPPRTVPSAVPSGASRELANDWCIDGPWVPNDAVEPPYTTSAHALTMAVRDSKHFADLTAHRPAQAFIDVGQIQCPTTTAPCAAPAPCGFSLRIEDHSPNNHSLSTLIEWVTVDAAGVMSWRDSTDGGVHTERLRRTTSD